MQPKHKIETQRLCKDGCEFYIPEKNRCGAKVTSCSFLSISTLPLHPPKGWEDSSLCPINTGKRKTIVDNEKVCRRCNLRHQETILGRPMMVCSLPKATNGRRHLVL